MKSKELALTLFLSITCSTQTAYAQSISSNNTQASGDPYKQYEKEAEQKSSYEISQKISDLKNAVRLKKKPGESIFSSLNDPDTIKATAYLQVLENRRKEGEPEAAFQYGVHELRICDTIQKNMGPEAASGACSSAMNSLKLAAEANDPRAMKIIGLIHKEGIGVSSSNFVAADWFIKSAEQYDKDGEREGALRALEEALNAVPDHPGAMKLRGKLLK